jgi:AraC-like DNA-binding protein
VSYRELAPPSMLASHVACLWQRTDLPERILPDGCVDLVWTGDELVVAGPATRAVTPQSEPSGPRLGLRFRVGAAEAALGVPAGELLDRSPALGEIWPDGYELGERVAAADPGERLGVLAAAVGVRLGHAGRPDPLVRAAVLELYRPRARIAGLSKLLGISDRQLRRRFAAAVGYPPRTLARILRLQRFLALAGDGGDLARLSAEAGYADQPHLTRDCSRLCGLPAAALLASGAGPAGERVRPA